MSDDDIKELVKRLRHRAVLVNYGNGNVGDVPDTDCNNAADALEAMAGEVAGLNIVVKGWIKAFYKQEARAEAAEAERDRLKAALEAIVKAEYSGGAKTAIARKALEAKE